MKTTQDFCKKTSTSSTRKTTEQFQNELGRINPEVVLIEQFITNSTKTGFRCKRCGYEWRTKPVCLLQGSGCPRCAGNQKKSTDQIAKELEQCNPNIALVGNYVNARTKVKVQCKICGHEWETLVGALHRGRGCPKCGIISRRNKRTKSNEAFIDELHQLNPELKLLSAYVAAKKKVLVKCSVCGKEWETTPDYLRRNAACSSCAKEHKKRDSFQNILSTVHPSIDIEGTYLNLDTRLAYHCKICGHEWSSSAKSFLKGKGCPKCHKSSRLLTNEQFRKTLLDNNPSIEALEDYIAANVKIQFRCLNCGYIWKARPAQMVRGSGCPRCSNKEKYSIESFTKRLYEVNPYISILSDYDPKKVRCRCKRCGNEWETIPNNLLRGHDCPSCFHGSTSYVEQYIFKALEIAIGAGKVLSRSRQLIGKELDIYIPEKKYAIEYGAWVWHKKRLHQDLEKIELCRTKDVKLLVIFDDCDEQIENNDIIVYDKLILYPIDEDKIKGLVAFILAEMNVEHDYTVTEYQDIHSYAYESSRKKTTEEFIIDLHKINSNIEIKGEYVNSQTKVDCKCTICGHEWKTVPNHLLQGEGCPACGGRLKKTNQQFVSELYQLRPSFTPLETYINDATPIKIRCDVCGNEWTVTPNNLFHGRGCPFCSGKRVREGFNDLATINPQIAKEWHPTKNGNLKPTDVTAGSQKKVWWLCNKGHEWEAVIYNRKKAGCPYCSNVKVLKGYNDLCTIRPDLASEWHPNKNGDLKPTDVTAGSGQLVWWICEKGHEWKATVGDRKRGTGCPYCNGRKL